MGIVGDRQTDRQTDSQAGRQTDSQPGRQTDRQTGGGRGRLLESLDNIAIIM